MKWHYQTLKELAIYSSKNHSKSLDGVLCTNSSNTLHLNIFGERIHYNETSMVLIEKMIDMNSLPWSVCRRTRNVHILWWFCSNGLTNAAMSN